MAHDQGLPRVCVVMNVYNGARFLPEAIDSILAQTLADFEFLIVDDASTDGTAAILERYAAQDARIRVLTNANNQGPYPSANRALSEARAPLIARMDADDISEPGRLAAQARFLEQNQDHIAVSSSYRAMDGEGKTRYIKCKPANDFAVQWWMGFRMCLEHPATMFRRLDPKGAPVFYDEAEPYAQDYELFARLSQHGKIAILREVLFHYRVHDANITATKSSQQKANVFRIARAMQRQRLSLAQLADLEPFMRAYLLSEPLSSKDMRAAIATMTAYAKATTRQMPSARAWISRQTAEILADAILRRAEGGTGLSRRLAFVWYARGFLAPLLWRVLENKNLLPRALQSHPDPISGF